MKIGLLVVATISTLPYCWSKTEILSGKFIESINQKRTTWVARRNFPEDTPIEQLKRLNGALDDLRNNVTLLGGRLEGRSSHEPCLPCGATGQRRDRSLPRPTWLPDGRLI
jgi:hypothetical protein